MATVARIQPIGNDLMVILSNGSRMRATKLGKLWYCPNNTNKLKTIEKYGSELLLKFTNGARALAYNVNTLWYVGPNPEPIPPFWWPFSLASANIYNGQPDDGFMTPGRPTHNGMDFGYFGANGSGNDIGVSAAGTVTASGFTSDGYGYNTTVSHGYVSTLGGVASTMYAHMIAGSLTKGVGDSVYIGETLGLEGSTGNSTGAHLHFVTMIDDTPVDPLYFMSIVNPSNSYVRL